MQHEAADDNLYLQQEILSASPLRLRWMLIQRAEELCGYVPQLWAAGDNLQAAGWLLRIREILGELLNGVSDPNNPVSQQVADFYVYLLQLLTRIEQTSDVKLLKTLEELLHLENETWLQVVQKSLMELPGTTHNSSALFPSASSGTTESQDYSGGFSIEV